MNKIKKIPIKFIPYFKSVIWGGDKICKYKSIEQPMPKIGESWEISAIPECESIVADGEYKGKSLSQMVEMFGESLLGTQSVEKYGNKFPLLIKLIDAKDNLSIQVHPDDSLAMQRHSCQGKTEMWYVIESEKEAKIVAGFKKKIDKEDFQRHVKNNTILESLAIHDSQPGDVFFLPAGRVHAIGAGNLLAEIQQASDITYRIFDYNRKDSTGKPRELHTDLALDAIDFNVLDQYKIKVEESDKIVNLVECPYFITKKVNVVGELDIKLDEPTFTILICISGKVTIETEEGEISISEGHTAFLPAVVTNVRLSGEASLLMVKI